jgi:hypothetical protein
MSETITVMVWDKPHEVAVRQYSKSVWIAAGDYMGKRIEVKNTSRGAAIKRWREAAEYQGNL